MAAIGATKADHPGRTFSFTWVLGDADTGDSVSVPGGSDRCVQAFGTFDSATVTVQGSNDGTNWDTLHDIDATTAIMTESGFVNISENPLHIRAITTGGLGSAAITVIMLSRSTMR